MKYPDLYHLTVDQNKRFTKQNLTRLVFTNSRFEGLTTTLPQTQTIIDGMGVKGVSTDDIETILQLKRGWEFILKTDEPTSIKLEEKINKIVALHDALIPGEIRTGNSMVALTNDETYIPAVPDASKEEKYLNDVLNSGTMSTTDKAMTIMYHNMRAQIFWDGNKRTATIFANKIMIDGGAGLINIPLDKWEEWNDMLSDFYQTDKMKQLKDWTYKNGIQGVSLK
ncbi:Fic family protein [Lactobacillus rodentium]|uniref:Filamentation induced by cAMP protein Fic n=1 Tax=Lactobacillus rodentium TaxID=947835 RepID=A0A2Z6T8R4_9LACO|nr:Fic family protein [Lactobacillus rodentium]MCR1894482.1 Fic family protein [Lactobacillus rodentium]GBG04808.1 filamentation induced by cAMP protein Fic [Lactobacillus rodentium]